MYCYRDYKDRDIWLGENHELLTNTFVCSIGKTSLNLLLLPDSCPNSAWAVLPKLDKIPRKFQIFVSNNAVSKLSLFVHNRLRDILPTLKITELQLEYFTTMAYIYRISSVTGYGSVIKGFNELEWCENLQLPEFLAQYIEAIGTVTTSSGIPMAPFFGQYEDVFPENCLVNRSPAKILEEAGRPIPAGPWAIDLDWLKDYQEGLTYVGHRGMKFRKINFSNFTGKAEMLVSVDSSEAVRRAYSPQQITEAEAQLGACFCYRDNKDRALWLGENHELLTNTFVSLPTNTDIFINTKLRIACPSQMDSYLLLN